MIIGRAKTRERMIWAQKDTIGTYLNLPGRHLQFFREFLAPWSVWFLVGDKDALQDLKLCRGSALAGLDGVWDVSVEHLGVYFGGIHARWNERGNV